MRNLFIVILLILCQIANINAATKRTIHVATAGTLPNFISDAEKYQIEELTLTGELNGTDFRLLRGMELKVLDLLNTTIVGGGDPYIDSDDYIYGDDHDTFLHENYVAYTHDNSISDYLFESTHIESIVLPNNVTSIQYCAFYSSSLTTISIPSSVTYIDCEAFSNCRGLTSLTIPNSVTFIGYSAFSGCSSLTSITIPNSVTFIDYRAFENCSGLTSITIPNNVTSIGYSAFSGCGGLTSITIPNSVTSIGYRAFENCSGLTSFTIPNSVTSIGYSAFSGCSGLTSITIPNSVTTIGKDAFYGTAWYNNQPDGLVYAGKVAYKYKGEMPANTQIWINDGTKGIAEYAFYGCGGLTSLTIPNSVTSIGYRAFENCSGLTSITIPNSVTSIGNSAFSGCSGLTSITIPNSVTSIDNRAFENCSGLTSITIPNSVTSISWEAFSGCSGLTSITIPNSVTTIGKDAFYGTAWYNNQPDGLVYAGKVAYKYKGEMPANTQIWINDGTKGIAEYAFYGCGGLTSLTIPNSVTSIGYRAFENCSGLTSITIPNSVTSIGNSAFSGCSGLTSLTIPNSVTSIESFAFYNCSGLTSVTIPYSVTSIGYYAFGYCKGLTTVTSEIENPFEIYSYIFSDDTYNVAELIVPFGTKASYQATEGWNKFTMITEAPDKDAVAFTIDGITYEGSKSEMTVVVKAVDTSRTWIEIPASVSYDGITYQVSGIADGVFDGSSMAALIWDVEAALPNNAFSNASIGSNFLLYVKSSSYAPSSVKNVVVDGTAQTIVLSDDGGQFYCPQAFTARSISYTHNYSMETGIGKAKGWETIALPFDVQKISHNTRGEIVPFPAYNSSFNQKPFWLANFSGSGFRRTAAVLANEPYIIAMPNSSSYRNEYNLAGDVTFSAENVQVPKTPSFSDTFLPAFATVAKSSSVYALNVNNRYVKYSGSYDQGSCFISGLRDVRPFEAYLTGNFTRGIIEIGFDDDTTDMLDVLLSTDEAQEVSIHTLSGQQVARTTQRDFDSVWQQLPKGVYLVNGNKRIK